jgi:Eukaryotic glutathione synthase, ATP binding domain
VQRFIKIADNVINYPHRQKKRLTMSRNDYMVEEENNAFYQVEYNLIAASLGSMSQGAREVHNTLNSMTGVEDSNYPRHI